MLYFPTDPRFADVVQVRWDGIQLLIDHGQLHEDDISDIQQLLSASAGRPQGPYGVFTSDLDVQLVEAGDDVPEEHSAMVDLVDLVEGAMSLHDVRTRLERVCRRLERAEKTGWQVSTPAKGGAFIARR